MYDQYCMITCSITISVRQGLSHVGRDKAFLTLEFKLGKIACTEVHTWAIGKIEGMRLFSLNFMITIIAIANIITAISISAKEVRF